MEGRICTKCNVFKVWNDFNKKPTGVEGRNSACRECAKGPKDCCPVCGNLKGVKSLRCSSCAGKINAELSWRTKRKAAGVTDEGRACSKCGIFQKWNCFRNTKKGLNGKFPTCKNCDKAYYLDKKHYIKKNGWTRELWNLCFDLQNGCCAIDGCSNPATHADHDHITNEPRALLCRTCNTSLGAMGENVQRILGLARYAEQCFNVKNNPMNPP